MDKEIVKLSNQLREFIYADPNKECIENPCTLERSNADFEKQIAYMRELLRRRPAIVLAELKALGYVPPPPPTEP